MHQFGKIVLIRTGIEDSNVIVVSKLARNFFHSSSKKFSLVRTVLSMYGKKFTGGIPIYIFRSKKHLKQVASHNAFDKMISWILYRKISKYFSLSHI